MKQEQIIIIFVLLMMCSSSSAGAMFMLGGEGTTGPTGPTGPAGPTGQKYTESCDDLGGGVIERKYAQNDIPLTLASCKQTCSADSNCLGFIRQEDGDFCQFHDNKTITNVDVCDKGFKIYRK